MSHTGSVLFFRDLETIIHIVVLLSCFLSSVTEGRPLCVCVCVCMYIYICCCVRIVSYYQHGLCIKWIHSSASELSDSKPKRKQQIRVCFWQGLQPRKLSRPGLWGDLSTCTGIILRIISSKREGGGAFDTLQWSLNLWNKPFVSIWCLKRVIQVTYTFTYGW